MIAFCIWAALLAAGAGALMLAFAARGRRAAFGGDPSIGVYRRALAEIEELAGRDLLAEDERTAVRAEAARRLLGAAERPGMTVAASGRPTIPLLVCGAVAVATAAIYLVVGSPGVPDQPFAARLAAWRAHPERYPPGDLAAALGAIADQRPSDIEPLRQLASLDLSLGDVDGATHALRREMVIAPGDPGLPAMLGEVKVLEAQGVVKPDARALFQRALALDPSQPAARYYLARAQIADGDLVRGLANWRALLAALSPTDPRRAALQAEIEHVQTTGKLPVVAAPAPPPGALSQAIRGMVGDLAAQLQAHPDDPGGWVRLVRAYQVLGETGMRDAALAQARTRYAGQPDVLKALNAAVSAGPKPAAAN